jgi:hypothetical protein
MGRRHSTTPKPPHRKRVNVTLIKEDHAAYKILSRLLKTERDDIKKVRIALAYHKGWRRDADNMRKLGCVKKCTDLDKEFAAYDFCIQLNAEAVPHMKEREQERLIFHELMHIQPSIDKNGDQIRDDKDRLVYRVRKHDREDFLAVYEKYGLTEDIQQIAEQAIEDAKRPLFTPFTEDAPKTTKTSKADKAP